MRILVLVVTLMIAFWSGTADASATGDREWQFRVLLDGKPIGTHKFDLRSNGESRLLKSDASFEVKFLFFTAYRYQHTNTEEWANGCLQDIDARTVTNGKKQEVVGEQEGEKFVIEKPDEKSALPSCIMTFAYWNADFLKQNRLLNPQTGEYLDVEIESLGSDLITVRGEEKSAQRYRITAKDTDLEVWYSPNKEWLALESLAKGGRKIRYELI
ncbi:MAG: hypothetical protein KJO19_01485 [Woeseia sp.]|nr:hypothetical protein [Woeseia sp.]MBT8095678.1 hypothetical protein [Woeseia sp.]